MKYMQTIGFALAFSGALCAGQEPAPAPAAEPAPAADTPAEPAPAPEPSYACDDAELEAQLADLKASAQAGDSAASRELYQRYSLAQHYAQADAWSKVFENQMLAKAEAGDVEAALFLGAAYARGVDRIEPDAGKAVQWYRFAFEKGDLRAAGPLGGLLKAQGDDAGSAEAYAKAYTYYEGKAAEGDAEALYFQGLMQMQAVGVPADMAAGLANVERAAELGWLPAAKDLYNIYYHGNNSKGVAADHAKALKFARMCADKGDGDMAYNAYCMFLKGQGAAQDEAMADHYLEIAAAANIHVAIYSRALRLKQAGRGEEAFPYFYQGASMHILPCMTEVGTTLLYGRAGQPVDEARGLEMLQEVFSRVSMDASDDDRAAAAIAAYEIACYYRDKKVDAMADQWFVKASDLGHPAAHARRGMMHLNPFSDLTWNPTAAYRYWLAGKNAGDGTCRLYINLFYFLFIPLLIIISFALPMLLVRYLVKRRAYLYKDDEEKEAPKP